MLTVEVLRAIHIALTIVIINILVLNLMWVALTNIRDILAELFSMWLN